MCKISVIIPVYNAENYLPECLNSVINQTLQEIEIICINDGSTDNSLSVLEKYSLKDSRIRILNQKNEGVSKARNLGIENAKGEFLAFLDADDWLPDNDTYKDLYDAAVKNSVFVCGGSFEAHYEDGTVKTSFKGVRSKYSFTEDRKYHFVDYQYDFGWVRFIYNRAFLNRENLRIPDLTAFEDPVFFAAVMHKAKVFYALKRITYCYRRGHHPYTLTIKKARDTLQGLLINIKLAKSNGYNELLRLETERIIKNYSGRGLPACLANDKDGVLKEKFDEINEVLGNKSRIEYEILEYYIEKQKETIVKKEKDILRLSKDLQEQKEENISLKMSYNWRVGKLVLYIPKKIVSIFRNKK